MNKNTDGHGPAFAESYDGRGFHGLTQGTGMDAEFVTIKELMAILKISKQAIFKKAKKEGWPFERINARGDRRFFMDKLPEEIRITVAVSRARAVVGSPAPLSRGTDYLPASVKTSADRPAIIGQPQGVAPTTTNSLALSRPILVGSPDLGDRQNKMALAWADLIRAYSNDKARAKKKGESRVEAAETFIKGYNTGMLLPGVFAIVGETSVKSMERNLKKFRDAGSDYTVLAPRWGMHKGQRKTTDDEFNTMLSFALHPHKLKIAEVVRLTKLNLRKRNVLSPSHEATLRRALEDWKNKNYDKWVFCREGEKALNDKCLPYIERDINVLDVGDVAVADGHVLNFTIMHPFTGKPCRMTMIMWYDWASCMPVGWEIMPTENVQCVAAGMRKAIITLGKVPKIAYLDNGKAFKAKVFTNKDVDFEEAGFYGMFARLDMETIFAWPYNAQSKPVERFFGTFNELERLMPTYTGASIQDKPAHMMRHELLHRQMHEKRYNGWVPTIDEANCIIARWVEEYSQRPHQGLKGLCPKDVFETGKGPGVDVVPLRRLMMSMEAKQVHRNGISFMDRHYYDDALYGYRERVLIRYDFDDLSKVYVYDLSGARLICEASAIRKAHPMAKLLGGKDDLEVVKEGIRRKRGLKKATEQLAREYVKQAPVLVDIPERSTDAICVPFNENKKVIRLTQGEAEKIEAEAAKMTVLELKPKKLDPVYMSEPDRYEALLERECQGETLELDDMTFMRYFEKTTMYRTLQSRFEWLREHLLVPEERLEQI